MNAGPATFSQLWLLLESHRPVALHRNLIRVSGNAKTAVLLSQLVYWSRRTPPSSDSAGWIHKTGAQWFGELGLSRREQESARAALKGLGVLEDSLRGQPAKCHYRLLLPQLGRLLAVRLVPRLADTDPDGLWADEGLVRELLGRALPYHRVLAYATGSVNAALLLTRVIFLHRRHLHAQGWFRFSRGELESELGLTRWELDTARKCLRGRSFVEERLAYLPTRIYARAVPPAILVALGRIEPPRTESQDPRDGARDSAHQNCGDSPDRPARKRHADWRDSRQSGCTKATTEIGGNPALSMAETLPSKSRGTTDVNRTTTTGIVEPAVSPSATAEAVVVPSCHTNPGDQADAAGSRLTVRHDGGVCRSRPAAGLTCGVEGRSCLAFPEDFLPDEREASAAELAGLPPERAQLVLDEVAGRSHKQRSVHTRVGLVRSLAQAERQGRFRPAYAWEVREARQRAAHRRAERAEHRGRDLQLPDDLISSCAGKSGYEAFKAIAARLRRRPLADVPTQTNEEEPT